MPDSTRQAARGRRSEARERRRSQGSDSPVEELEDAVPTSESNGSGAGTAAKVVGTALAAGLLGAVGGAAKAYLERRDQPSEPVETEPESAPEPEPGPEASAEAPSHQGEPEDQDEPEAEAPSEPQPQPEEPELEAVEGPQDGEREDEGGRGEDEDDSAELHGVAEGEAAEVVDTARRQLESLLGTGVERVSGLDHANGGWRVTLEAVEVHRVPESTDVMASYEVVLDGESKLVSVNRIRRYRRSQVDDRS